MSFLKTWNLFQFTKNFRSIWLTVYYSSLKIYLVLKQFCKFLHVENNVSVYIPREKIPSFNSDSIQPFIVHCAFTSYFFLIIFVYFYSDFFTINYRIYLIFQSLLDIKRMSKQNKKDTEIYWVSILIPLYYKV